MTPPWRKLGLTAHVAVSVGWLGAVATSLALGVAGLVSDNLPTVRGAYLSMELIGRWALVPFSVASLLTGLAQSLGTSWGLVRHYWVLTKLLINVAATIVLLLYLQTLGSLARLASIIPPPSADPIPSRDGLSPVLHGSAALVLLVVATTLSVYKPRGLTRYGQRKQQERSDAPRHPAARPGPQPVTP